MLWFKICSTAHNAILHTGHIFCNKWCRLTLWICCNVSVKTWSCTDIIIVFTPSAFSFSISFIITCPHVPSHVENVWRIVSPNDLQCKILAVQWTCHWSKNIRITKFAEILSVIRNCDTRPFSALYVFIRTRPKNWQFQRGWALTEHYKKVGFP